MKENVLPTFRELYDQCIKLNLSTNQRFLLLELRRRMSENGNKCCWPAQNRLASDMGITVRSVYNFIRQLSEIGIIKVEKKLSTMGRIVEFIVFVIRGSRATGNQIAGTMKKLPVNQSIATGKLRRSYR